MKNIDSIIDDFKLSLKSVTNNCVFVRPDIPEGKAVNARNTYATDISVTDIIILIDDTLFGGAKDGMIITLNDIYYHVMGSPNGKVEIKSINRIVLDKRKLFINEKLTYSFTMPDKILLGLIVDFIKELINLGSITEEIKQPDSYKVDLTKKPLFPNIEQPNLSILNLNIEDGYRFLSDRLSAGSNIHFGVGIPENKYVNAKNTYASEIKRSDLILLADDTVFGNSKNGMLITYDMIYWKIILDNAKSIQLNNIYKVDFYTKKSTILLNDRIEIDFTVLNSDEKSYIAIFIGIILNNFANFIR
ncbi:MAG: hypothetical protein LBF58_07330 [Deltaproteobacteria bacterium]|jgi:hypothetical protein|nr:hypothetical protein [Deltaproteobacteria bacterium]